MRSLPENRFWNNVKSRLENYSEEPDDNWDLIAGKIQTGNPGWSLASGDVLTVIALLSLLFLINIQNAPRHLAPSKASDQQIIRPLTPDIHQDERANISVNPQGVPLDSTASGSQGFFYEERSSISKIMVQNEQLEFAMESPNKRGSLPKRKDESVRMNDVSPVSHDSSTVVTIHALTFNVSGVSSDSLHVVENKIDTIRVITANKADRKSRSKFHSTFYASITPSLGYYRITPDQSDDLLITAIHTKGMTSGDRLGVQFDVGVQHRISSDFEVFGGISYYSQHQTFTFNYLTDQVGSIESSVSMRYELAPSEATRSFRYSTRNVGVTAGAFYILKASRLSHRLGAGIQYQKGYLNYKSEGTHTRSQNDLFNFMIAYRLQASLSRHIEWYIQPSFTQSVSEQRVLNESFAIKPYRVGVGFGVLYRF
jgi:hypothetical protein